MKSKVVLFLLCLLLAKLSNAQGGDLMVQGITPNLYIVHAVQPKENWYSIGRLYNANPKEIAPYNSLSLDKPLSIGHQVKVPLTIINFSQDGNKAPDEVFVPVYHIIQEKEWLYRISVNYNKVPVESLEKWNSVTKDQAKAGLKLVIGYLKVKNGQSSLAFKGSSKTNTYSAVPASHPAARPEEKRQDIKEDKKSEPFLDKPQPLAKNDPPKQENKPAVYNTTPVNNNGGYFKSLYEETGKSGNGNAGIFKSTSGWSDGKYYALINNVPVGTILKVTSPSNGKTIYAKVLGSLPDMKESAGLTIRVSDAAAAILEASGNRFGVEVKY